MTTSFRPPIGSRITSVRIARGVSLEDMARVCGVDEEQFKDWTMAITPEEIPLEDLKTIAFALDLDVGAFTQDTQGFLAMMLVAKQTKFGKIDLRESFDKKRTLRSDG